MTIQETLISMGYRELSPGKWSKPIGFHALTYTEMTSLWDNWFHGLDGKIALWESDEYIPEDQENHFLSWLKCQECYTRTTGYHSSAFHFLTLEEKLKLML